MRKHILLNSKEVISAFTRRGKAGGKAEIVDMTGSLTFTSRTKEPLSFIIKSNVISIKITINLCAVINRIIRGIGNFVNIFACYYTFKKMSCLMSLDWNFI